MSNVQGYSFRQHLHNYSVWTASRAVQRSFTSTRNIKAAIDNSKLREFSESEVLITDTEFEAFHRNCANEIINRLRPITDKRSTYGRAAKIIAIYLKTSIIVPSRGQCMRSKIIHPPIDGILLKNLSLDVQDSSLNFKPWTQLNEDDYWNLVLKIKSLPKAFDWTLETYWHPEIDV
jgi:hypothetical protein